MKYIMKFVNFLLVAFILISISDTVLGASPDISFSYSPKTITQGETETITLTFKNVGDAPLRLAGYYWDGSSLNSDSADLGMGKSRSFTKNNN